MKIILEFTDEELSMKGKTMIEKVYKKLKETYPYLSKNDIAKIMGISPSTLYNKKPTNNVDKSTNNVDIISNYVDDDFKFLNEHYKINEIKNKYPLFYKLRMSDTGKAMISFLHDAKNLEKWYNIQI